MRRLSFTSSPVLLAAAMLVSCDPGDKGGIGEVTDSDSGPIGCDGVDLDGDGEDSCSDCDDDDAAVNSGAAELCDSVDNNCDGTVDEGVTETFFADDDGDGFGDDSSADEFCSNPGDYSPVGGDCDDGDAEVFPGAEEVCDGADNDCNGQRDDGLDTDTWWRDSDGDAYGDPNEPEAACAQPEGYVDNDDDCDDTNTLEPIHVDVAGTSGGTGSSSDPVDTIQAGIDLANSCVRVASGTYSGNIDFGGKNIAVEGVAGAESTIIEGTGDWSVVTFSNSETADASLSGFTITNGTGTVEETTESIDCGSSITGTMYVTRYYGGGIYVNGATPSLWDLRIVNNTLPAYSYSDSGGSCPDVYVTYSYGGGIFQGNSAMSTDDVWFESNYADNGGGAFINATSSLDLTHSVVNANSASAGGGVSVAGSFKATNDVVVNNSSDGSGGGVGGAGIDVPGGLASLFNVSLVGNDGVASVYLSAAGSAAVDSSINSDNDVGYLYDGDAGTSLAVKFSDAYGGAAGNFGSVFGDPTGSDDNIALDPYFVGWSDDGDYSNDDLTLDSVSPSPCIDLGNSDSAYNDNDGTRNDQGAYGGPGGSW